MISWASTWPSSESLAWRSSSSAKTFSQPTVMSYSRMLADRLGLSSPVSASTRYAANPPALRRNSTLDRDTSPQ